MILDSCLLLSQSDSYALFTRRACHARRLLVLWLLKAGTHRVVDRCCGVERPCRAIAVDRDVVSVVGGQRVNRAPASSPASHRVGRDSHGRVVDPHLDVSSLLLEQSLWSGLLRLGDLAELIVVAIVEVAVALVARVEALLGVGSGVGGQLGVVQGGRLPVRPLLLLLLLVGVVDPRLVGHRDSSLVLRSRQVFIPVQMRNDIWRSPLSLRWRLLLLLVSSLCIAAVE